MQEIYHNLLWDKCLNFVKKKTTSCIKKKKKGLIGYSEPLALVKSLTGACVSRTITSHIESFVKLITEK